MVLSNSFLRAQFTYMIFVYLQSLIHYFTGFLRANIMTSSQSWLVSPVGGALHQYRRRHGLKTRTLSNSFFKPQFTHMIFIYLQPILFIFHFDP